MRFLIDDSLPNKLVADLQARGHDVVRDTQLASVKAKKFDRSVIVDRLVEEERILVTRHDAFSILMGRKPSGGYTSVIVICGEPQWPGTLCDLVQEGATAVQGSIELGCVAWVKADGLRLHRFYTK